MIIGVPKEIKTQETRVAITAQGARQLVDAGHKVEVERGAGLLSGISDEHYAKAGAHITEAAEVWNSAEMIVKVKEPQPSEYPLLREGQVLFTYLHLAPDPQQTAALVESGCVAVAYETVTGRGGALPLLAPMSEVAGRMSIQAGAQALEKIHGGAGVLLGGVPGVAPAKVVVIGGGVVGTNAIRMAMGMEAQVTVLDRSLERLTTLDFQYGGRLNTIYSTRHALEEYVLDADLVVGAVLVPGAAAPKLVTREMIGRM